MKILKKLCLLFIICLPLCGCNIETNNMKDIDIYTTTYPIKFLITSLYGDYSKTYSIYPNGVNIDEYKISKRKLEEYSKSDLFVFNSLDKDRTYAVKMINNNNKLKVIDVSTGMKYNSSVSELWLNPYNYLMMAENLKNGLHEYIRDPYLQKEITKNYESLSLEVSKIDADLTEAINNAKYKTIVTDNDMFKFLEKYGLTVISLEENDNLSQNKIEEVKKLVDINAIKYVYSIKTESNATVTNLIKQKNLKLITINDLHSIDGKINNTNDNYLTVMKNNINLIKTELYK